MLGKWDYSCNQILSYKKSFASTKLWNKIKVHVNLYIMGCPFSIYTIISMYTEILSYSRANNICWMENNPDGKRALSSSLLRAIVAHNHLPFFKIFSNLIHLCLNFQIICSLLIFFLFFCFSRKSHTCTLLYFEFNQIILFWKVFKINKNRNLIFCFDN